VFVTDGIEGVPPAVYLLVQELVALVSNNHVELRKSRTLRTRNAHKKTFLYNTHNKESYAQINVISTSQDGRDLTKKLTVKIG
jgi:hypothetical protein